MAPPPRLGGVEDPSADKEEGGWPGDRPQGTGAAGRRGADLRRSLRQSTDTVS